MLTIEYDAWNGIPVADGVIEMLVLDLIKNGTTHYITSNENFILATRALIADGKISHTEVQLLFKGQILALNKDGRCLEWPAGFCDFSESWLARLLSVRTDKNYPDLMDVLVNNETDVSKTV